MKVLRAFRTELDLNNAQRSACVRFAGAARWAYNFGLARKIAAYQAGEKTPSAIDLHRELNVLKKTELAWMHEVSKCAPQEALRNLDQAFANFFRRVKAKKAGKKIAVGFPRFKSKKRGPGSFRLTGSIHIFEKAIQLPRLGRLRLKERGYLPTAGIHILSATVSERAGRWFVSVQVEMEISTPKSSERPAAGVDLGINRMAQVSDGTPFENPHALKCNLDKIKRLQRTVARRVVGSANRRKAVQQLARLHLRVANIRKDAIHKSTSWLARTKSVVVLEDLNVSGMMKNHHLALAIGDVGWYEFRRQMQYKGAWYGCRVVLADRTFPSTKRCSSCGHDKDEMDLSERTYRCEVEVCGLVMDRDLPALAARPGNAAKNLEKWSTASSGGIHACREERCMYGLRTTQVLFDEAGTKHRSVLDRFEQVLENGSWLSFISRVCSAEIGSNSVVLPNVVGSFLTILTGFSNLDNAKVIAMYGCLSGYII